MDNVDFRPPAPAASSEASAWIGPRLIEQFGAACRTIPTGFAAYARVLHPADPGAPTPRGWAEVAESMGRVMHPLAQFDRISTPPPGRADSWADSPPAPQPPSLGSLEPEPLRALCDILGRHTPPGSRCWFAVWEGWGDLHPGGGTIHFASRAAGARRPAGAPPEWQLDLGGADVQLPGRRYLLYTGPLDDALRFGSWATQDWFQARSPNLFWPQDRTWCVATEIDFDSTLVAGPAHLIDEVVSSSSLEAWAIGPTDSLAHDADTINAQ